MKKNIIIVVLAILLCGTAVFAIDIYTDTTPDSDETVKVISKEYDVPATTATVEIDMGKKIDFINEKKKDVETILIMMNGSNGISGYNDGLSGLKSATQALEEATCSFPTVPTKVEPVALIEAVKDLADLKL